MRKRKNRPILSNISVLSDGETESWYLHGLKTEFRNKITIKPELHDKKPLKGIFRQALEESRESEKVFLIIDFDGIIEDSQEDLFFEEFENLHKRCDNVVICINNPCLEYWFLLHFKKTRKYYQKYKDLEKDLRKELTSYEKTKRFFMTKDKSSNLYDKLRPFLFTAVDNAKDLPQLTKENKNTGSAEIYKLFLFLEEKFGLKN